MAPKSICSIEGCGKPIRHRGWCAKHYKRWYRHGDPIATAPGFGEAQSFFENVVLTCKTDQCLDWPFSKSSHGYGQIRIGGKLRDVHRLVCERIHGEPPSPKYEAAHSCGRGHVGCVNPNHLSWKTPVENNADKLIHGTHNRGQKNPGSKLSERAVMEIRSLKGKVSQRELARRFGVTRQTICDIGRGKTWSWL